LTQFVGREIQRLVASPECAAELAVRNEVDAKLSAEIEQALLDVARPEENSASSAVTDHTRASLSGSMVAAHELCVMNNVRELNT
jgi:hypothetical protein